jgi:hypothetical protein
VVPARRICLDPAFAGIAACQKGCTHCWHIPVTISIVEAVLIGRHIGRKPTSPLQAVRLDGFDDLEHALNERLALCSC